MIRVKIFGIALDGNHLPIVLLKDVASEMTLPIWIGIAEAAAIADGLENKSFRRPLTYDLMKNIIDGLNASVEKVVVTELIKNTFHAKIYLIKKDGEHLAIDSRPSDAIALAVRTQTPIYVAEKVMEESGRADIIHYAINENELNEDIALKE